MHPVARARALNAERTVALSHITSRRVRLVALLRFDSRDANGQMRIDRAEAERAVGPPTSREAVFDRIMQIKRLDDRSADRALFYNAESLQLQVFAHDKMHKVGLDIGAALIDRWLTVPSVDFFASVELIAQESHWWSNNSLALTTLVSFVRDGAMSLDAALTAASGISVS